MSKQDRKKIQSMPEAQGMWAIFRNSSNAAKAYFTCLHETEESAKEEARRLAADFIGRNGPGECRFYVCKVGGFCGINQGVLTDSL